MSAWRVPLAGGVAGQNDSPLRFGPMDCQLLFSTAFGTGIEYKSVITRNINLDPFIISADPENRAENRLNFKVISCIGNLAYGMCHLIGVTDEAKQKTMVLAETIGMSIPEVNCLNQDSARSAFKAVFENQFGPVIYPAGSRNIIQKYATCTTMDNNTYQAIPDAQPFTGRNLTRHGLAIAAWPPTAAERELFNDAQRGQVWFIMCSAPNGVFTETNAPKWFLKVLATVLVSISKQGNCTPQFLVKIRNEIESDTGQVIELDQGVIKLFYARYGSAIDETNIQPIINRCLGMLPDEALKLGSTLFQSAGTGLTQLHSIGRALVKFPNFNWEVVAEAMPADWNRAMVAITAVGQNQWYGYKKNLGVAKSSNYANIAIVARDMLIKGGVDPLLRHYQGWKRGRIPQQDKITAMINLYFGIPTDYEFKKTIEIRSDDPWPAVTEAARAVLNAEGNIYA